jgi:hypothetical protein
MLRMIILNLFRTHERKGILQAWEADGNVSDWRSVADLIFVDSATTDLVTLCPF